MPNRPGRGVGVGGRVRRGGGGGIVRGLLGLGTPQVDESGKRVETQGPTPGGASVDTQGMSAEDAALAERGIKIPIYKKPGLFTNLLTAGAAGQQTFDANERAQAAKNEYLSQIATERTRQEADRRLEELRHSNAIDTLNAGVMTGRGLFYTKPNADAYNTTTFAPALTAATNKFNADAAKAQYEASTDVAQRKWLEEHPQEFSEKLSADAAKQGIINESTRDANNRANRAEERAIEFHPYELATAQENLAGAPFRAAQQAHQQRMWPTQELSGKQMLASQQVANDIAEQSLKKERAQEWSYGYKDFGNGLMGNIPTGAKLMLYEAPRDISTETPMISSATGQPIPGAFHRSKTSKPGSFTPFISSGIR